MSKRLILAKSNLNPNFIGSWEIEGKICDQIIPYYGVQKEWVNQL